ncbi:hypothetical protein JZ751_007465 [Albula glossodonta]|uniref:Ig-like domain-containing protein n=1 Tax=Albula glossodonta TaxID=121402 RepID=A0A8T2NAD0_9TELE|nr:hypothetical protein JZ751_007465 [Albula glossodonta]
MVHTLLPVPVLPPPIQLHLPLCLSWSSDHQDVHVSVSGSFILTTGAQRNSRGAAEMGLRDTLYFWSLTLLTLPELTVTSSRGNETIREGDSVTLTCIAKNCSLRQSELTWLKDKLHLPGTNATLEFSPFHSRHSGIYSCAVKGNLKFTSPEIQLGHNSGVLLAVVAGALVIIVCVRRRRAKSSKDNDRTGNTQVPFL